MLCMQLTYCVWRKSFVSVCKLFVCSERVYQNRLKFVERGHSDTVAITLLETRMYSLSVLSKWKLMNDFFCEILVFLPLEEILCILRIFFFFSLKKIASLAADFCSVSALVWEKGGDESKLRKWWKWKGCNFLIHMSTERFKDIQ